MPSQELAKCLLKLAVQSVDAPESSPRTAIGELHQTGPLGQKLR